MTESELLSEWEKELPNVQAYYIRKNALEDVVEAARGLLKRVRLCERNGRVGYKHLSFFATKERELLAAVHALTELEKK